MLRTVKINTTLEWLLKELGNSVDVINQVFSLDTKSVRLIYLKSICDEKKIDQLILKPFFEIKREETFKDYLFSLPNYKVYQDDSDTLKQVLNGSVCFVMNEQIILFDMKKVENSSIGEAMVETVIQGPKNALSEDIQTNINIIRNQYHHPTLRIEEQEIGSVTQTRAMLVYDEKFIDLKVLDKVKESISKIDIKVLQSSGQLHRILTKKKRSLFPTMMITERPDRIVYNLAQGKVVIFVQGTQFALILPAVFFDFMSSMEDMYQPYWIGRFIVSLRYIGLFISIMLPSLYVGLISYNPEILRVQLTLSIAGSRQGVPFPSFLEVLFMLLMMELLTEASIRLPKSISSTATTVGGLILGQAATEAGLVSNIMIIIVAAVAISNFVIPINEMGFAMRIVKYLLLVLSTLMGVIGLVIGVMWLIFYLINLETLGQPYLKLFIDREDSENRR